MNTSKVDAVVLLAHLMDENGVLNEESRSRADLAAQMARDHGCEIITTGWRYRRDLDLPIAEAMSTYLVTRHGLPRSRIIVDVRSRDTVGDAVYSRDILDRTARHRRIAVATSAYHVPRTECIFGFVYGEGWVIDVRGAPAPTEADTLTHEAASTRAFLATFDGVKVGELAAILRRMGLAHPFYNGDVYERI